MGTVKVVVDVGQLVFVLEHPSQRPCLESRLFCPSEQPSGFITHLVMDCLSPCAQRLPVYTRSRKE